MPLTSTPPLFPRYFGRKAGDIFVAGPELSWYQSAPIMNNYLAFNGFTAREASRVLGNVLVKKLGVFEDNPTMPKISVDFTLPRDVDGIEIFQRRVRTKSPFQSLRVSDEDARVISLMDGSSSIVPLELDYRGQQDVACLLMTAICEKFFINRARATIDINALFAEQ